MDMLRSLGLIKCHSCYALHYALTGKIIPPSGGAAVRWFSNYEKYTNKIPEESLRLLQGHGTLRQGKKDVSDQFGYSWAHANDADASIYFAYFRQSFAIIGFVWHDRTRFPDIPNMTIHVPGFAAVGN